MPAAAAPGRGGSQRGTALPRAPKPNPSIAAQHPASPFAGIQHAISTVTHAAAQAPRTVATPRTGPRGGGSDALSSGPGYGSSNAYKQTPQYKQAIADVFNHQPAAQKGAILSGLMRRPGAFKTPEGQAIHHAWLNLPVDEKIALQHYLPHTRGLGDVLGPAFHQVEHLFAGSRNLASPFGGTAGAAIAQGDKNLNAAIVKVPFVRPAAQEIGRLFAGSTGDLRSPYGGSGQAAISQGAKNLAAGIQQLPLPKPINQETQLAGVGAPPQQIAKNALKDAVNLYAEAIPSIAIPAAQALSGHPGKAFDTAIGNPVKQLVNDPIGMAQQHPVMTALMVKGGLEGVGRLAETGGRALLRKPADLSRPAVQLTGTLTKEHPNYSKYALTRREQKTLDRQRYSKSATGETVHRSENARQHDIRVGVSSQVGVNERIRRANVQQHIQEHAVAVLAPRAHRAVRAATTALKYDPGPGLIPAADVLAHIAEGTIRRPGTFIADLEKRIAKVSATRADLLDFPKALAEHDAYVKRLQGELTKAKRLAAQGKLAERLKPAFRAAEQHAAAYAPLERQALDFGHYGSTVAEHELERRVLTPIVVQHMDGARFDPVLNTAVRAGSKAEVAAELGRLRSRAKTLERQLSHRADGGLDSPALQALQDQIRSVRDTHSIPVPTSEMRAFAKRETGGRPLSYASHQAPRGDSAFFVSGQKFPSKALARNTMYAHAHGLVDPTHEGLLQSRVHLAGVVDAHRSMGRLLGLLTERQPNGEYWKTFDQAKRDAPAGYRPINVGRIHSYEKPSASSAHTSATLDEEAVRHSLDINGRLQPSDATGNWAVIHNTAADQLLKHANQISPNMFLRAFRASTGQFRKVALGTSIRHLPGVLQEDLIRAIASGVFIHHWIAERSMFREAEKIDPQLARERRIQLGGGQMAGATRALATRQTSRAFEGTSLHGPLKGFEALMRSPGPRQLSYAWNQWTHFAIDGTKKVLEENFQRAGVGKQLLNEFGGMLRLQGDAARIAAEKGYLPEAAARKLVAGNERMWGKWTDMTPEAQTALMFSPFGMWWVNSAKWLARLPVDHPVKTGLLASTSVGTDKERQALGLDMFAPNHLPLYEQGGIPANGKIVAQNYYSAFGVLNDPLETAASLIEPTIFSSVLLPAYGDNYLARELTSPAHPHGGPANPGTRARVILNSLFGLYVPLYTKATTIAQGGASAYDTSTLLQPQTKGPNPGPVAGLRKAVQPLREFRAATGGAGGRSSNPLNTFGLPKSVGGGGNIDAVLKSFGG